MTDQSHPETAAAPEFRAVLTPHRSLSRAGFGAVMLALSLPCLGMSMVFLSLGAWPVAGFLGLDVALVYWAFRANFADARRSEIVEIAGNRLAVTQIAKSGNRRQIDFNASWVNVSTRELSGDVCELALAESGRRLALATFLGDAQRRDFAAVLRRALSSYRRA